MYLPELLRGILACDTLEDLCAAGVLVGEFGDVVDVCVDDDVHALVGGVVGGDVGWGECLRHGGGVTFEGVQVVNGG
jgi:hypothetical protein